MKSPLISVMMPVYNGLPLIKASIESLLQQTYTHWECIIVNDGSTDATGNYLASLTDPRFRVHHFEQNQGRPFARQKALEMAHGKYLAMLDAGDLYAKNKLEIQLKAMEDNPSISLVSTGMCSFGLTTPVIRYRGNKGHSIIIIHFTGSEFPCHATCMMRAERAKQFKYDPKMKLGQDRFFLAEYLRGTSYMSVPDMLYFYSEFDSVSKKKIQRTYWLQIKNYKNSSIFSTCKYMLKYICSWLVFPFISTENIIKKRGRELTPDELQAFNQIVSNVIPLPIKQQADVRMKKKIIRISTVLDSLETFCKGLLRKQNKSNRPTILIL